jgi:nitrite reductase (cytochrome c-552)
MKKLMLVVIALTLFASVSFAQENCTQCHSDVVEPYLEGPHGVMGCIRCHENGEEHATNPQTAPGVRVEANNCGECHQLQYNSYVTGEDEDQTTQKQDEFPLLRRLLAGHPFAEDYREPRSHINMISDFVNTSRPRSALCMYCKSSDVYWQWGDTITYESNAGELLDQKIINNPITCVQCHNPHVPGLRVVQPALNDAIERMPGNHPGKEDPLTSRVCGQCHVNYNFNPAAKGIEFPFVKVAEMLNYVESTDIWRETKTGGWEHPDAGTMLYKVQHPETELYWDSVHHKQGVTCSDCHMPKIQADSGETYTQHWLSSPLNYPEEACGQCHSQSGEELVENVKTLQQSTHNLMENVMTTMASALDNLSTARDAANVNEALLTEARESYFNAHLFWEWIAAENSMGFHNFAEAGESLERALGYAENARDQAAEASGNAQPAPVEETPDARTFPWVPLLLGLAVVIGAITYFIRKR